MAPVRIPGTLSKVPTLGALVYLPPQYGDPAYAGRTFPVVELLAGFPGTPRTWSSALSIASVLNTAINSGRSVPFIAVMPSQWPSGSHDSECVNAAHGLQMNTYLSDDVRSAVRRLTRASLSDGQWGVLGLSTGGYCAANLAFHHPSRFPTAVSIAGYDHAAHDRKAGDLFGSNLALAAQNNIVWRERHMPDPALNLLLVATMQDPQSVAENQYIERAASAPLHVYMLTLARGGHNANTFDQELPTCFGWMSRFLGAPLAPIPSVGGHVPVLSPRRPEARPA